MKYPEGIKKTGANRWKIRATVQMGGRRLDRERTVSGELADAQRIQLDLLDAMRAELENGGRPARPTLTGLAKRWLEDLAAEPDDSRLKESTLAKYRSDLEKHVLPMLGDTAVDVIEPWQVADLLRHGAAQSRRNRRTVIGRLAEYAVQQGYRRVSWMPSLRIRGSKRYTEDDPNLLDDAQTGQLLAVIPAYWSCLVHTEAFTGLRWGEASGLLWSDLDLRRQVARIARTNWRGTLLATPKNKAALRDVPLPTPLPAMLEAHRRAQLEQQHPGLTMGLVFPTAAGTPHAGWPLIRVLRKACLDLGFPRLTTHGLRRTYNNLLRQVAKGIVVRSIVGHMDEAMTEHYSVVAMREKAAAAAKVVALILPASPRPPVSVGAECGSSGSGDL